MAGKSYKLETKTGKLCDVLDEAFSDVSNLGQELTDWADNMEDGNLGATEKYQRIRDAADELQNNENAPSIPKPGEGKQDLGELEVVYSISIPRAKGRNPSRQVQLENACSIMDGCLAALDEYTGDLDETDDDAESLRDEIEQKKDQLEGLEIPGMYG